MKSFERYATCPKCGNKQVGYRYVSTGPNGEEGILRFCNCGYAWLEAPLDAKEEKETVVVEDRGRASDTHHPP